MRPQILVEPIPRQGSCSTCGGGQRSNRRQTREAPTMRATRARNINSKKKDLSPGQREELLRALKARGYFRITWAQFPEAVDVESGLAVTLLHGKEECMSARKGRAFLIALTIFVL